jgi:hypothetical protein
MIEGGQDPIWGAWAHYRGCVVSIQGGQVPIIGGSGAHYRGQDPMILVARH